nr:SurA N-terminal domain-containing protein [Desulfobulbaceae bacterium]
MRIFEKRFLASSFIVCLVAGLCFSGNPRGGTAFASEDDVDYSMGHDGADQVTVARVNGVEIKMSALLKRMRNLATKRAGSQEITPLVAQKLQKEALDTLITEELAYLKAFSVIGVMPPSVIDTAVESLRENYGGAKAFEDYLAREGVSLEEYRVQVERNLVVRNFIRVEFGDTVTVSQEEIDAAYPAYPGEENQYLAQLEKIQVSELRLFLDPESEASLNTAKEFREKIVNSYEGDLTKIPNDGTFFIKENVALNKSVDKALYDAGKKLADAKKTNGLSEPVVSGGVVKIIQLTGYMAEVIKSADAVRYEIKKSKQQKLVNKWVAGLKDGADIEIFDLTQ